MKRYGILSAFMVLAIGSFASVSSDLLKEGLRLDNEGKTELALQTLQQAADADTSDATAQTALGAVALRARRFDVAQTALERAVAIDPKAQTALYSLAMLYEKQKRFPEARDTWQKFLNLSPSAELSEMARRHLDRLP